MKLAPDALPDDGLFDVMLIGDVTKLDFVTTAPKLYSGRHVGHPQRRGAPERHRHGRRGAAAADRARGRAGGHDARAVHDRPAGIASPRSRLRREARGGAPAPLPRTRSRHPLRDLGRPADEVARRVDRAAVRRGQGARRARDRQRPADRVVVELDAGRVVRHARRAVDRVAGARAGRGVAADSTRPVLLIDRERAGDESSRTRARPRRRWPAAARRRCAPCDVRARHPRSP